MSTESFENDREFAVLLLNDQGAIVDANPSCPATFGWTREELIGRDILEILQSGRDLLMDQLALFGTAASNSSGNTDFSVRVLARRKDQSHFPARVTARRFDPMGCWTIAFYSSASDLASELPPNIRADEIQLAAKFDGKEPSKPTANSDKQPQKAGSIPFWRNSRLLSIGRKKEEATPEPARSETEGGEPAGDRKLHSETREEPTTPTHAVPKPQAAVAVPTANRPLTNSEVQRQFSDSSNSLARLKSDLERERGERSRLEQRAATLAAQVQNLHLQLSENLTAESAVQQRLSQLESDLREAREAIAQRTTELEREQMNGETVQEQLRLTEELKCTLELNLARSEAARASSESVQRELDQQLQSARAALRKAEGRLAAEAQKRQALEFSLAEAFRRQRELEEQKRLELAKAESSFLTDELKMKRLEEEAVRSRAEAVAAIRSNRATVQQFGQKVGEAVQNLNRTTCDLLQTDLPEDQEKVIESVLKEVLALETSLRDSLAAQEGANPVASPERASTPDQ